MKPSDLRIVLADDHKIIVEALELTLSEAGFNIVSTAHSPGEALKACAQYHADILLTDLLMPDGDGIAAARKVRAKLPACKVIILTGDRSPWQLARAKQAGIDGYVSKNAPVDQLVATILEVAQGERIFDPTLVLEATTVHGQPPAYSDHAQDGWPTAQLSNQETRVLKLISAGLSNAEMAGLLNISPHTIKAHVRHIFTKLDVSDRTSAAIWAVESGKVSIEETSPSLPLGGGH